ncbi:MAG: translesion error-prone DNA polymerase V autoproteolytic subunit [Pseudomonadota bacterium]
MKILVPKHSELQIPMFPSKVPAGFPSPADEYLGDVLDLNEYMIKTKSSTFFITVEGDSMVDAGILDGDVVVVDRSLTAKHGSIVIAAVDNEFTLKRLSLKTGVGLLPENKDYKPIYLSGESELLIWGCVTGVVRKL